MSFDARWVLGVRVDVATTEDVLRFVGEHVVRRSPARIVTVNAEFVVRARADPVFAHALGSAELATADGAGILWALRRQGAHLPERVGGSDLIWSICEQGASHGHRVFFLGGEPGVAESAASRIQARYPNLQVAGTYAGTPDIREERTIVDLIHRSSADIVLVAYGAPRQDVWLERNLVSTGALIGMGVGGSFDYVAGRARRAPVWMQRHGLEWLWRLIRQPRRWRRMLAIPVFVWLVWRSDARDSGAEG